MKSKIFVSGCLGGAEIRYNGTGIPMNNLIWQKWELEGRLFHFCPELAAGFNVPRPAAEIVGGHAIDIIEGTAKVIESTGNDATQLFIEGAELAVEAAKANGVVLAVMTDGSPSCGSTYIGAGNFDGSIVEGKGVVAQMLQNHGIEVFPHTQLEEADKFLYRLESGSRQSKI